MRDTRCERARERGGSRAFGQWRSQTAAYAKAPACRRSLGTRGRSFVPAGTRHLNGRRAPSAKALGYFHASWIPSLQSRIPNLESRSPPKKFEAFGAGDVGGGGEVAGDVQDGAAHVEDAVDA